MLDDGFESEVEHLKSGLNSKESDLFLLSG